MNRRTLSLFKTALEARSTAEQDKIFAELDFAALLHTFPIWAVTNPHAAELLPLEREMFDLVIVDEASQCDVASALPLLYRARRAIVCGDPKQLRHLSWLREDRQAALASQHGLSASQRSQWNYRTHSLLDVVNGALPSQDDVVLLDEHYRSLPQIIEFSNRRFYGTALRIMTTPAGHHRAAQPGAAQGQRQAREERATTSPRPRRSSPRSTRSPRRGQEGAEREVLHRCALTVPRSGELPLARCWRPS